uniref:NAD(P)-binding domain-containing protein n=1 Tax=Bosea sp. NBC_00436 TaxID=2969620 RepID=A0A9E7ZTZ6_9HYPH
MTIGYVGLGAMGNALARRLVGTHPTLVWDLNPKAVETMERAGGRSARDLRHIAEECDVIFLCLPRSKDVESVLFGSGMAEALRPGALVIDQTSGIPAMSAGFAKRLAANSVGMIDAPVAGGVPAALAGSVAIMVSGPDTDIDRALPLLHEISPRVFRCSHRVGDAQASKLVNNCVNSGYRMATLELVALGRKFGLSLPVLTDVLSAGWGANFTAKRLLPALVEGRPSTDFSLALMLKDVNQCLAIAASFGVPMPISSLTRGLMQAGQNLLTPTAGLDEIVDAMEQLAAAPIRPQEKPAPPTQQNGSRPLRIGICSGERLSTATRSAISAGRDVISVSAETLEDAAAPELVIDFTRRAPADFERLAARLAERGIALVDAASGSVPYNLIDSPDIWLCGGSASAFALAGPVLEGSSGRAIHCGAPGSGRIAELVGSAVAICNRAAMYENAWTGLAFGLEPSAMATALNEGSGWSAEGARVLDAMKSGDASSATSLGSIADDMDELMQLALTAGAPLFLAGIVRATVQAEVARTGRNATLDELAPPLLRRGSAARPSQM